MLGRAVGMYWHALVRDVLALGYRTDDMFTTLSVADMVAIVVGAPPNSSLRYFLDGGWSREAHLLANMQEREAGLAKLTQPYQRPGLQERNPSEGKVFEADSYTWEEFDEMNKKRYTRADELAAAGMTQGNSGMRTW